MGLKKRVFVIGIGGASCSGKTLLAKHIRNVLPSGATILHQDDFAPPIEQVPYSPDHPTLQDWDDPPTCILWSSFRDTLSQLRTSGTLPEAHQSHDHLNKQVEVEVDSNVLEYAKREFGRIEAQQRDEGFEVIWFIVDGFVLYWDPAITEMLDVKLFLRVQHDLLQRRREERQTYVLQNPDDAAAGGVWTDPPKYFDMIVWPAYVKAHQHIFDSGDVETGGIKEEWTRKGLELMDPKEGKEEMTRCFKRSCEIVVEAFSSGNVGHVI